MAEAFGIFASSLEVVNTVLKLRSLLKEVKAAPATVSDLLEEAEFVGKIISGAKDVFSPGEFPPTLYHTSHLSESTALCRKAVKSLHEVVEALDKRLSSPHKFRRKVTAINVYLKKEEIERLKTRLDRAVRLLVLANQHVQSAQNAYILAQLSSTRPQIYIPEAEASSHTAILPRPAATDPLKDALESVNSLGRGQDCQKDFVSFPPNPRLARLGFWYQFAPKKFACRVSFPTWYTQAVWDIQAAKAIIGWKFIVRTYRYRGSLSVIRCIMKGNILKLQELFECREASLFDRDYVAGFTLQHWALMFGRSKISRFLTEQGLDASEVDSKGQSALLFANCLSHDRSPQEIDETYSIQVSHALDIHDGNIRSALQTLCCCSSRMSLCQFQKLRDRWFPFYDSVPIIFRLMMVRSLQGIPDSAQKFRHIIASDGYITKQTMDLSVAKGMSLLHAATYFYGQIQALLSPEDENSWQDLLRDLVHMNNNLHDSETWRTFPKATMDVRKWDSTASASDVGYASWTATPFLALIRGAAVGPYSPETTAFQLKVLRTVKAWLRILSNCGVDLAQYGYREKQFFLQEASNAQEHVTCVSGWDPYTPAEHFNCNFWVDGPMSHRPYRRIDYVGEVPPMRLANFTYGARPEDWELRFESSEEEWIGTFWDMAEREENLSQPQSNSPSIPGGWVEEE